MPEFNFGDIVLVRFHPSHGQELKKYRPAVIVSSITPTIDLRFNTIVPFTTKTDPKNDFEIIIHNSILKHPSLLLCWYVRTIDSNRLVRKLGKLNTEEILNLKKKLMKLFS